MDAVVEQFREQIRAANAHRTPLRLRGGGTKDFYGENLLGDVLDTSACSGIVDYEPSELVITARCGTPLAQIEAVLAEHGQFLPFEPPSFGSAATIGGVVSAGLSGPRRAAVGAARDFVLGACLLDARGELLRFGGQVMKNVAGFDVSRALCGSLGVLGLITEVSLKVLPLPRREVTICMSCDATQALDRFNRVRAQPLPISATAWHAQMAYIRLSGAPSAVDAACQTLVGELIDDAQMQLWWRSLRNQTHAFFAAQDQQRLWRLSLPPTTPLDALGGDLIEWSGALRWLRSDAPESAIRERARQLGGHATVWHGARSGPMFQPLARINLDIQHRLKRQFDPNDIFNRGRLLPSDAARGQ